MIELLLTLVIVGIVLYLLQQIPMDPTIALIIKVVVILLVVIYLVQALGFVDVPLPRLHR